MTTDTAPDIVVYPDGTLICDGKTYRCAIGKSGITAQKSEGDGASPIGSWKMRYVMFRPDHGSRPATGLPTIALDPQDGWCDAPDDPAYNRPVRLPFAPSHEKLWRDDALYDLVVALDHNDDPAIPGNGSAIFMHIARPDYGGTEGCVALARGDLEEVLQKCRPASKICILGPDQALAAKPAKP
jgi:L,D-peptidoglycan transpeptidase YkuD (ErfK/YbiS/YcfS/YnhG family)